MRRQQELDQPARPAAAEARGAALGGGADELQDDLHGVAGGDRDERKYFAPLRQRDPRRNKGEHEEKESRRHY